MENFNEWYDTYKSQLNLMFVKTKFESCIRIPIKNNKGHKISFYLEFKTL